MHSGANNSLSHVYDLPRSADYSEVEVCYYLFAILTRGFLAGFTERRKQQSAGKSPSHCAGAFSVVAGVTKNLFVTLPIALVFGCGGGIMNSTKAKGKGNGNEG